MIFEKLFKSTIFNAWFSNAIIIFSMLIAMPIVLMKLSIEEVNVWFLFATIVSLTQGIVTGFSSTFTRFIAYSSSGVSIDEFRHLKEKKTINFAEINTTQLNKILNIMKPIYFGLSILFFIILYLVGHFFLTTPISMMSNYNDGWIAWYIVLISSTFILYFNFYQVFLDGINKVILVQRIIAIVNFIGFFIVVFILTFYPTLIYITLVYQLVSFLTFFIVMIYSKKYMKRYKVDIKVLSFDKELFMLVFESAWKSGVTTIVANIVKHISSLIVAQMFSPSQSASFQFIKRIFDVIERFTVVTFNSKIPVFAQYRSRGDIHSFKRLLFKVQALSYSAFTIGFLIFLFFGNIVAELLNAKIVLDPILIILFGFSVLLTRWAGMKLAISNQANYIIEHVAIFIISTSFFTFVYLFIDYFGLHVFPLAQIVAILLLAPFIIKKVYNTFEASFINHEKTLLIPTLIVMIVLSIIYGVFNV